MYGKCVCKINIYCIFNDISHYLFNMFNFLCTAMSNISNKQDISGGMAV